jgi:hypothetical protein
MNSAIPVKYVDETRCYVGIDPGHSSGALAFYFPASPERITAEDVPFAGGNIDIAGFADRIRQMKPDAAIIEAVNAMPGQGVSSTFKFGKGYGIALGILGALHVPVYPVTPGRWKKHFGLSSDKDLSREAALRLWPAHAGTFARKKDAGRAEAALIARYGAERFFYHGGGDVG